LKQMETATGPILKAAVSICFKCAQSLGFRTQDK
jgi:hypothetical protein